MKLSIKILAVVLFGFLTVQRSFAKVEHGLTIEMVRGLGYTLFVDRFWTGFSMNASLNRFNKVQLVIAPRIFVNYDVVKRDNSSLFLGGTYADNFGVANDSRVDKHRLIALTGGLSTKVSDRIHLAAWINLYGIYETLIYDPVTEQQVFSDPTRHTNFDFGGISLTYVF
jgi:hypothetical protein